MCGHDLECSPSPRQAPQGSHTFTHTMVNTRVNRCVQGTGRRGANEQERQGSPHWARMRMLDAHSQRWSEGVGSLGESWGVLGRLGGGCGLGGPGLMTLPFSSAFLILEAEEERARQQEREAHKTAAAIPTTKRRNRAGIQPITGNGEGRRQVRSPSRHAWVRNNDKTKARAEEREKNVLQ